MEQTATPQTTSVNGSSLKVSPGKQLSPKLILFLAAILIIIVIAVVAFQKSRPITTNQQPWNSNPKFIPAQTYAKVGQQPIYGSDLNYVLYTNYPNNKFTDQQAKTAALSTVATSSAILQAAKAQNIISVPDSAFSPTSNPADNQKLVNQAINKIENGSDKYSTSVITIWYYDMDAPRISESTARQTARSKLAQLYNQVKNGSLTMQQAGDKIKSDTSLAKLDQNYQGNAYSENKNWTVDNPAFTFNKLNQVVYSLQPGQISDLVEVISNKTMTEKFFAVIKMEDRQKGQFTSLETWLKQAVQDYPITTQTP